MIFGQYKKQNKINDDSSYHLMAALRYVATGINPPKRRSWAFNHEALEMLYGKLA